jgi:transcriptional regulator with PAS, ATPase and Fis domain
VAYPPRLAPYFEPRFSGKCRELVNIIERAVVFAEDEIVISSDLRFFWR